MRRRTPAESPVEMQMGPMIDMVFLLLVFFMVTSKPIKQESDITLGLPGSMSQEEAVDIPDEQRIDILPSGEVVLNEQGVGTTSDVVLLRLVDLLARFKASADAARSQALVTLNPDPTVRHQRVVDVLNACAKAGISGVTFSSPEEDE
ncbi:MAG: ExbD/TolR family protein [Verrucomicrobiales bacterium]